MVETETERLLLTWRLHADDFDMPLGLIFEWDRFAAKDGRWLGKDRKAGSVFPEDTKVGDAKVVAEAAEFAKSLRGG